MPAVPRRFNSARPRARMSAAGHEKFGGYFELLRLGKLDSILPHVPDVRKTARRYRMRTHLPPEAA